MIDKETVKRLDSEREKRIKDASVKLLENSDLEGAKQDLAWAETSSKLIASTTLATRLKWSALFICLCLLIVGLLWTLHVRSTHISLDILTQNVSLTIHQDWSSKFKFLSDHIFINNIKKVSGLNPEIKLKPDEMSLSLELSGKDIMIDKLDISAPANIELRFENSALKFFIKKSQLRGDLFVKNAALVIETDDEPVERQLQFEIPETIKFESVKTMAEPVYFEFRTKDNWRLRGMRVNQIGFLQETISASGRFESSVQAGKVILLDTKVTRKLREADYLIIKKIKECRRLEISKAEKGVKLLFEGSVGDVFVGPEGFYENITPRYLEYIYHHQLRVIFWGAILFIWGMLWRTRNWFSK